MNCTKDVALNFKLEQSNEVCMYCKTVEINSSTVKNERDRSGSLRTKNLKIVMYVGR